MNVAIIGAGLAGTACAYILARHGVSSVIYEAGANIAPAASGNKYGLYNPRLTAYRTAESDYYSAAFALALQSFAHLQDTEGQDIGWHRCGALHLMTNEKKAVRFPKTIENWGWPPDHMQLLTKEQASDTAGIELPHGALYLPDSGYVSPVQLCRAYAANSDVMYNTAIQNLHDITADAVILACGMGTAQFEETAALPLKPVRGQVTHIEANPALSGLKTALCYGGYCTPAAEGMHMIGATFQRWLDHSDIIPDDDAQNIEALRAMVPALPEAPRVLGRRAGVRTTGPDHFPLVGRMPGRDNLYVSTAHGSHGIISTLMAAQVITDMILGQPAALPVHTIEKLSPARFSK